jgi:hypothetical protein
MANKELQEMIDVGRGYPPSWALTADDLQRVAVRAAEQFATMNGDTGTVEISVKQFAELVAAWDDNNNRRRAVKAA